MADPDQMQSLLSRAVEEQAAEQRAVSTLLGQIASRLETLAGDVSSLGTLENAVGAVDVDLRTSTTLLADRINALSASLAEQVAAGTHEVLGRDVAGLRGELARIAARPAAPALDEVSTAVHSGLAQERPAVRRVVDEALEAERPAVRRVVDEALEAERPQTQDLVVAALEAERTAVRRVVDEALDTERPQTQDLVLAALEAERPAVRHVVDEALAAERTHALTAEQVAAVVRRELEAERAHNAQTALAVVEASEQRILAYVDTAVLALAEALLLPRRPGGGPGLATSPEQPVRRVPSAPAAAAQDGAETTAPDSRPPGRAAAPADGEVRRGRWRPTT